MFSNNKLLKDILNSPIIKSENPLFDIVIPVGPNEINNIINLQIEFTKRNIIGYRNIYIISIDKNLNISDCIIIDENIFPFNKETIAKYHGNNKRNGWYLQQLLKLYAGFVIPDIMDKYLVIDSDTFFLKPTTFISDEKPLYNYGTENHKPYFQHMVKLDKNLIRQKDISGICHHMMFEKKYLIELFELIENNHNNISGITTYKKKFYDIFLENVDIKDRLESGASEYEIYFNYMIKYHYNDIIIRPLKWENVGILLLNANLDYISCHCYLRR